MKKDPQAVLAANRRRAEDGDKWAQEKLGMRLLEGDGVTRNVQEAKKWLQLAAEQGSQTAVRTLEEIDLRAPVGPAESVEAEMQRGLQLSFRGEHRMAAEAFFNCTEMAPADPAPCYNAACSYALSGQVEWACRYLREAIDRGMEYDELMQDPDRDQIFGDDHRYAEVWLMAEQRSRETRLHERDLKAKARKAAMAEAEIRAKSQLDDERDLEAEVSECVANAEQIDGTYKMKGLGVRSLLFDTIRAFHDAERMLDAALRSDRLSMKQKRKLDVTHQQIGRRFDVLCTKAASMKEGASELERTLDDNDDMFAREERERLDERSRQLMHEWDNDWEVAKHKYRLGISPADPVSMTDSGTISTSNGTKVTGVVRYDAALSATASTLHLSGKLTMRTISEADVVHDGSGRVDAGELSASGDLSRTGSTSIIEVQSDRSNTHVGRQEQLAFELALGSAAAAAGHGRGGHAAAASALADAERMLLVAGAAAGDPVVGYRWYRLCIAYAGIGDETAACRSFAAAVDGGLHKVSEYREDHLLRPQDHPILAACIAGNSTGGGGAPDGCQMRALSLLIERFARSQNHAEQEQKEAFFTLRAKTTKQMTAADLMSEGISVNKAGDAAEKVRAMHMRRSGGFKGLVDPSELPGLDYPSQNGRDTAQVATIASNLPSSATTQSTPDQVVQLPTLVPNLKQADMPAPSQVDTAPTGLPSHRPMPAVSAPALADALGSLSTSSDLLYLQEAGDNVSARVRAALGPDPLEWGTDEVCQWLESLSLAMHCQTFAQHLVDGETLLSLTPQDISESLRVTKLGHCKILTKGILALRAQVHAEAKA